METTVDGFRFSSAFDSGNLADVSAVDPDAPVVAPSSSNSNADAAPRSYMAGLSRSSRAWRTASSSTQKRYYLSVAPDCAGTDAESVYRGWFYFSVAREAPAGRSSQGKLKGTPAAPATTTASTTSRLLPGSGPTVATPTTVWFTIVNFAASNRIFDYDNRPVFRVGNGEWQRLGKPVEIDVKFPDGTIKPLADAAQLGASSSVGPQSAAFGPAGPHHAGSASSFARTITKTVERSTMRVTWSHTFQSYDEPVYFAMCYPYSYAEQQQAVSRWQEMADAAPEEVYLARETLGYSAQGRVVDLLTITAPPSQANSATAVSLPREPRCSSCVPMRSAGGERPHLFADRTYVLLTARVHPGETPGSHVLHGFVEWLLSSASRAAALRRKFVFKVVPMLNPDGVVLGHYRTDSFGANLNRCYDYPSMDRSPTIFAVRDLFRSLAKHTQFGLYMDLHAHASKRGCFVFANAWDEEETQVTNMLFPKLFAVNCPHFDFPSCDFTSRSMTIHNRKEGATKEGTGRVALAMEARLVHSYTFEVSYNTGLPTAGGGTRRSSLATGGNGSYTTSVYQSIGRALGHTILDFFGPTDETPWKLRQTPFLNVMGLRSWLHSQLRTYYATEEAYVTKSVRRGKGEGSKRRARSDLSTKLDLPSLNPAVSFGRQLSWGEAGEE